MNYAMPYIWITTFGTDGFCPDFGIQMNGICHGSSYMSYSCLYTRLLHIGQWQSAWNGLSVQDKNVWSVNAIVNDITNSCFQLLQEPYTEAPAKPKMKFIMSLTILYALFPPRVKRKELTSFTIKKVILWFPFC